MSLSLSPVLAHHEIERIHRHSLDLLERVGIDYRTPRALDVLAELGCPVDYDRTWASLPRDLVEWALTQAPRVVRLSARDRTRDVILDGRRPHHTTDSQGVEAIDFQTGSRRPSTVDDLRRGLLFADALDMIEIVNVMVAATDVPAHLRTLHHFALAFTQTSKHVRTGVLNPAEVPYIVEMVQAVTGEDRFRPIFSVVDCTISPLMHDRLMTEACIELAKLQVPIMVYPMPLAGGTAPVTLGGAILLHNIEFLSGLVLYQAVNPGVPVIYGTGSSQLDMQTGRYGNSADVHGLKLALAELGRFYNLPVNLWGLSTAAKGIDVQYGYEAATSTLLAYLACPDEIYSMGLLGSAQILSLEKMVLDNHLARQIEIMARPVLVDERHLQADLIERVGIGGHFLGQRETRTMTRREYVPMWPPAGEAMAEIAHQEAADILQNHRLPPLPPGAEAELAAIIARADEAMAGQNSIEG